MRPRSFNSILASPLLGGARSRAARHHPARAVRPPWIRLPAAGRTVRYFRKKSELASRCFSASSRRRCPFGRRFPDSACWSPDRVVFCSLRCLVRAQRLAVPLQRAAIRLPIQDQRFPRLPFGRFHLTVGVEMPSPRSAPARCSLACAPSRVGPVRWNGEPIREDPARRLLPPRERPARPAGAPSYLHVSENISHPCRDLPRPNFRLHPPTVLYQN